MLRPDPAQEPRLRQIIANLVARIYEATERGWLGEVEGREASPAAAEQKLQHMGRIAAAGTKVDLGMPGLGPPPGRT